MPYKDKAEQREWYNKIYYPKNKRKILQKNRRYILKNKDKYRELLKQYRLKNKAKIRKDHKEYNLKNRIKILKRKQKWRLKNKAKLKKYMSAYYLKNIVKKKEYILLNKDKIRERMRKYIPTYTKNRKKNDPTFKLVLALRSRFKNYLKLKRIPKTNSTMKLVGCSPLKLKDHIENQFLPGMNWKNYNLETWHIDHIKPLAMAKSMKDIIKLKLMHYTNLQPMWATENIKKSDFIDGVKAREIKSK